MSTHGVGFVPPDDKWRAMKAVWDAAQAAEIPIPSEVMDFFDGYEPDPAGVNVTVPVRNWTHPDPRYAAQGFELDVSDIPPHVKTLRFYNSW